jgi:hypothetical protein
MNNYSTAGICYHCLEEVKEMAICFCPCQELVCAPCSDTQRAMDDHLLRHGCLPGDSDGSDTDVDNAEVTDDEDEEDEDEEGDEEAEEAENG